MEMDYTTASNIFSLSQSLQGMLFESKSKKLAQSNSLLSEFTAIYNIERSKLPFRLNLLDNLKINENAHSKFLIRILQHKPSMINFMEFLNQNSEFNFDVNLIKKPLLTAEMMRIDGLIREENKYAIIIENKIHDAVEQKHQIARYIDKCCSIGFKVNQIYVLYLTKDGIEPTQQIWGIKYQQEHFYNRYIKLSYRFEILSWLENYAKTLPIGEELLKSAIIQYEDHLKSLFKIKKEHKAMNEELRNFLSAELNLGTSQTQNIEILTEKITEINELSNQMNQLLHISKKELFKEWKNELGGRFKLDENQIFLEMDASFLKTGVKLNYNSKRFSVLIEYDLKSGALYYGFGKHYVSEFLDSEISEFLSSLKEEEGLKEDVWWYGWKNISFSDGYGSLIDLIKQVMERITYSSVAEI